MTEKKIKDVIVRSSLLVGVSIFCMGGAIPTIDAYIPPPDTEAPRDLAIPSGGRIIDSVELSQEADIQQESSAYTPPPDDEAPVDPS